jgi:ketosteroid isomerase-like protein
MSQENVEIVRRSIDAFNRGDRDAWLADFAPEAEWQTTGRFADEGAYRGRAGLERFWAELQEDIEELSVSVSDLRAIGDRVFVAGMGGGRGKRKQGSCRGADLVRGDASQQKDRPGPGLRQPRRRPRSRWAVAVGDVTTVRYGYAH